MSQSGGAAAPVAAPAALPGGAATAALLRSYAHAGLAPTASLKDLDAALLREVAALRGDAAARAETSLAAAETCSQRLHADVKVPAFAPAKAAAATVTTTTTGPKGGTATRRRRRRRSRASSPTGRS